MKTNTENCAFLGYHATSIGNLLPRKTSVHFLSYLAQFFLERETFQIKAVEKINTHIFSLIMFFFFSKILSL